MEVEADTVVLQATEMEEVVDVARDPVAVMEEVVMAVGLPVEVATAEVVAEVAALYSVKHSIWVSLEVGGPVVVLMAVVPAEAAVKIIVVLTKLVAVRVDSAAVDLASC